LNMRIVLFALTGMGNETLKSLLTLVSRTELLVFTRGETNPFPYYQCEPLKLLCKSLNVTFYSDCDFRSEFVSQIISEFSPDIGITATFHRILPKNIRDIFRLGCFNIHSSLLPNFRGPTPTAWTILHDELLSGLTFHEMTDTVDVGNILHQVKISVNQMNDGELRHRLSLLAGSEIPNFMETITTRVNSFDQQSQNSGSSQPHILSEAGLHIINSNHFATSLIQRSTTPYPGYEQFLEKLHAQKAITSRGLQV